MRFTIQEQLMFNVMEALYESGVPIDFKGSMVLKSCLEEAGYPEEIRLTEDIDGNWYSETAPTPEQMTDSVKQALQNKGIPLDVQFSRMYGDGRSAGLKLIDPITKNVTFTMDIDVNRPEQPTRIYQIGIIRFRGITPYQILADKISVVSTHKVFRRIKDVIDLYYLSQAFEYTPNVLLELISSGGRSLGDFNDFLYNTQDLRHAYERFRLSGNISKSPFEDVYTSVKSFIRPLCPRKRSLDPER